MIKQTLIGLIFSLSFWALKAQNGDYSWWNEQHWDGVSHWSSYIGSAPKYLGPNALPIPEFLKGRIDPTPVFSQAAEGHFTVGGETYNLWSKLHLPMFGGKYALNLSGVPFEYFWNSSSLRDFRKSRQFESRGQSVGDVYVENLLQLFSHKLKWPDVLLRMGIKTASGNNLSAARFTDSPAYYFDVSFGKSIYREKSKVKEVRFYGDLGLYVWQTRLTEHPQNDAILLAIGIDFHTNTLKIEQSFGSYWGYLNQGDRPVVYRAQISSNRKANVNYFMAFQDGFKDAIFRSFRIGFNYDLTKIYQRSLCW